MLPWDPLWRLRHVGYPVSPRGYRGLPAFASLSMAGSAGGGGTGRRRSRRAGPFGIPPRQPTRDPLRAGQVFRNTLRGAAGAGEQLRRRSAPEDPPAALRGVSRRVDPEVRLPVGPGGHGAPGGSLHAGGGRLRASACPDTLAGDRALPGIGYSTVRPLPLELRGESMRKLAVCPDVFPGAGKPALEVLPGESGTPTVEAARPLLRLPEKNLDILKFPDIFSS